MFLTETINLCGVLNHNIPYLSALLSLPKFTARYHIAHYTLHITQPAHKTTHITHHKSQITYDSFMET